MTSLRAAWIASRSLGATSMNAVSSSMAFPSRRTTFGLIPGRTQVAKGRRKSLGSRDLLRSQRFLQGMLGERAHQIVAGPIGMDAVLRQTGFQAAVGIGHGGVVVEINEPVLLGIGSEQGVERDDLPSGFAPRAPAVVARRQDRGEDHVDPMGHGQL